MIVENRNKVSIVSAIVTLVLLLGIVALIVVLGGCNGATIEVNNGGNSCRRPWYSIPFSIYNTRSYSGAHINRPPHVNTVFHNSQPKFTHHSHHNIGHNSHHNIGNNHYHSTSPYGNGDGTHHRHV